MSISSSGPLVPPAALSGPDEGILVGAVPGPVAGRPGPFPDGCAGQSAAGRPSRRRM